MDLYALIKVDYDYYTFRDLYGIFSHPYKAINYANTIDDTMPINTIAEFEDDYDEQQRSHWYIEKYVLNHRPLIDKYVENS